MFEDDRPAAEEHGPGGQSAGAGGLRHLQQCGQRAGPRRAVEDRIGEVLGPLRLTLPGQLTDDADQRLALSPPVGDRTGEGFGPGRPTAPGQLADHADQCPAPRPAVGEGSREGLGPRGVPGSRERLDDLGLPRRAQVGLDDPVGEGHRPLDLPVPGQQQGHGRPQGEAVEAAVAAEQLLGPVGEGEGHLLVDGPGDRLQQLGHGFGVEGRARPGEDREAQDMGVAGVRLRPVRHGPVGTGQAAQQGVEAIQIAVAGLEGQHRDERPAPAGAGSTLGPDEALHAVGVRAGQDVVAGGVRDLHEPDEHVPRVGVVTGVLGRSGGVAERGREVAALRHRLRQHRPGHGPVVGVADPFRQVGGALVSAGTCHRRDVGDQGAVPERPVGQRLCERPRTVHISGPTRCPHQTDEVVARTGPARARPHQLDRPGEMTGTDESRRQARAGSHLRAPVRRQPQDRQQAGPVAAAQQVPAAAARRGRAEALVPGPRQVELVAQLGLPLRHAQPLADGRPRHLARRQPPGPTR
ncbi:hypothetical protein GCM10025734_17830 [Kitasatospora paranensis]|uniref:hypothetical protein n=1 Tax=Kitasatospora paranensis TaxID=258053 RepID=UPI0031E85856